MWTFFSQMTEARACASGPGRHRAGRGLWLCRGEDGSAAWEISLNVRGARRDLRLGTFPEMSVKSARKEAAQWRGLARSGLDPAVEQEAFRNAAARNLDQFYC